MSLSKKKNIKIKLISAMLILLLFSCQRQLPEFEDLPEQTNLPDPFTMLDGTPVESKEDWVNKRRPELKELFQHYVYGYLPPVPAMNFIIKKQDEGLFDGKATYKEVEIDLILPGGNIHRINLALFVPNKRSGPAPVFMAVNKCGNHQLVDYEGITIIEREWLHGGCKDDFHQRGIRAQVWALENTINRGYALASFAVADR